MSEYMSILLDHQRQFNSKSVDIQSEDLFSYNYALYLDQIDILSRFQSEFLFPKTSSENKRTIYLCGNSLGLQPKRLKQSVNNQLEKWEHEAVEGHFKGDTPWLDIDDIVVDSMCRLVGALSIEVVMMNSLTCNLHLMLISFYKPTKKRFKILIEKKAFPSDYHAVVSQIQLHGYDPIIALLEVSPIDGEVLLHQENIDKIIELEGDSIALILFSGIQYYTGQLFNLQKIIDKGHSYGCIVGFDLAHAVGNVPLYLHDWDCDFACWCTYKYMNCGPGSLGGCFVHERYSSSEEINYNNNFIINNNNNHNNNNTVKEESLLCNDNIDKQHVGNNEVTTTICDRKFYIEPVPRRLAGWWGHRREDRFLMAPYFIPCIGANGFRVSNPPVLLIACIRASLDLFDEAGIIPLRYKSILLTGYLEYLILSHLKCYGIEIFTPTSIDERGCQLSITIPSINNNNNINSNKQNLSIDDIINQLYNEGIICDSRKPNVIRIAPVPLYNSFLDIYEFINIFKRILSI